MSKRHARRIARNVNPSKPRWRKEGRALQQQLANAKDEIRDLTAALKTAQDDAYGWEGVATQGFGICDVCRKPIVAVGVDRHPECDKQVVEASVPDVAAVLGEPTEQSTAA